MKLTVNGMTIEGTPDEVTTFLQMNNLLPNSQSTGKNTTSMKPSALNLLIYKQMAKRQYQAQFF